VRGEHRHRKVRQRCQKKKNVRILVRKRPERGLQQAAREVVKNRSRAHITLTFMKTEKIKRELDKAKTEQPSKDNYQKTREEIKENLRSPNASGGELRRPPWCGGNAARRTRLAVRERRKNEAAIFSEGNAHPIVEPDFLRKGGRAHNKKKKSLCKRRLTSKQAPSARREPTWLES